MIKKRKEDLELRSLACEVSHLIDDLDRLSQICFEFIQMMGCIISCFLVISHPLLTSHSKGTRSMQSTSTPGHHTS